MRLLSLIALSALLSLTAGQISVFAQESDTVIIKRGTPAPDTIEERGGDLEEDTLNGTDGINPADRTKPLPRSQARQYGMLGFGPAGFGNAIDNGQVAYNLYGGYAWDVNQFASIKAFADVTADFVNSVLVSANLGLNFIPFAAEISPFFGASLGLGWGNRGGDNAFGFDIGAGAGLILFRTSTAQMIIDVQGHILLNEIGENFPYNYAVRVGILF